MRKRCVTLLLVSLCVAGVATAHADRTDRIAALEKAMYAQVKDQRYDKATRIARKVYRLKRQEFGRHDPKTIRALDAVLSWARAAGDTDATERLAKKIYGLKRAAFGPGDARTLRALHQIVGIHMSTGDYAAAERAAKKLVAATEAARGPDHQDTADAMLQLASVYHVRRDGAKAKPLYQRIIAITKKNFGTESSRYIGALQTYGSFLQLSHAYSEALATYRKALSLSRKAFGDDAREVDTALLWLAYAENWAGNRAKAVKALDRLVARKQRRGDMSDDALARSYASLYASWGKPQRAQKMLAKAEKVLTAQLEAAKKAGDRNKSWVTLFSLASVLQTEKKWDRAIAAYRRLAALRPAQSVSAEFALAAIHHQRGDLRKSARVYEKLAQRFEKKHDGFMSTTPQTMLALVYREMGRYAAAERAIKKVLRGAGQTYGKGHLITAQTRERMATIYLAANKSKAAIRHLDRALRVQDKHLSVILGAGTEADNRTYFAKRAYQLDVAITAHTRFAPRSKQAAQMALRALLVRKGRVLDAAAQSVQALRQHVSKKHRALFDRLAAARSKLAQLVIKGPKSIGAAAYQQQLSALQKQVTALKLKMRRVSAAFRAQDQKLELSRLRRAIPKDAALVEIASYRVFDPKAKADDGFSDQRRYVAYVVRRRGPIEWVDLGDAKAIEGDVKALREALSSPGGNYEPIAKKLYGATIAKLESALEGIDRLVIAPDGALNLLPFAVLVDESGRHLVRRFTISYVTSGRDLLRFAVNAKSRQGTTIIADPNFENAKSQKDQSAPPDGRRGRTARALRSIRWTRLPGTADEAEAIASELRGATVLLGPDATESALKHVHGPRILHIATHGFFLPAPRPKVTGPKVATPKNLPLPMASSLGVTPPKMAGSENPLLRSGLALAGANSDGAGPEDGLLTALEAVGLDLWGTELVVLSACETGVGKVTTGDGVYGLRRAFTIAGVESLVMSLWQVDDAATRDLMIGFYKRLASGVGRAEALRRIKLRMLADDRYAHPYYWASFIHAGQWAPLDAEETRR